MASYHIYVDASADVDPASPAFAGIEWVPMTLTLGGEEMTFRGQDTPEEVHRFYDAIREGGQAHTSQVTPDAYRHLFRDALAAGEDVVCLCLSSGLTKTFDSIRAAQEKLSGLPGRLYPVDTLGATGGIGLLAEAAVRNRDAGMSAAENAAALEKLVPDICYLFMVDDLMHLKRGGRVSSSTAVMGTMLHIKPILVIDMQGRLTTVARKRGTKMGIRDLVRRWTECHDPAWKRVYVLHADDPEKAEAVRQALLAEDPDIDICVHTVCPVIGAHVGPGMVATAYAGRRADTLKES